MKFWLHFKKFIYVILAIFIVLFALSGVYSTRTIDKLAYVIALGLDVGENNTLKLSIQLSKPSGSSGGSSDGETKKIVNSIECSSISSGLNLFNSYLSRRVNLSHCKVIVISEELAASGISDYIYTLLNDVEMSPHANVIISKSNAREFLDSSKPELEELASKYYELAFNSSEYTGYTQNVTLIQFFSDYVDTFKQPVAILGSVNSGSIADNKESAQVSSSDNINAATTFESSNEDSSYKAGETPMDSKSNIENMGLAVFKGGKLVGELTGLETIYHLIVSNQLKSCKISIPNPIGDSETLDLNIKLGTNIKNELTFVNGNPYISTDISLDIKILSTTEGSTEENTNYYSKENTELIEKACNEYLKDSITDYLYKTSKNYQSDIDGFGKYAVKYFSTIQDWQEYDWLNNYENSIFHVMVESNLKSGYTFL